ncbi:hypothetical protein KDX31_08075 [Amphritea atlantica]|uniref:Uncharacterized protein n=1 Tax=Amphritea atlantica TaxID=355243 RepID=A0ABY5GYR3_9GAMM|nr:hypothetical protein KDX31_08075 [Amphritea atlantica]
MLKRTLMLAAVAATLSMQAFAGHCPMDAKAIDNALPRSNLNEMEKAEIQALRDEGMRLHENGDHRMSEKKMATAMRKLLDSSLE